MANPQPTDAHLIMAHSIEEQLMVSDFSEQQGRILRLILRLSWGCGNKWAQIPHQSDFEIVGVGANKVKSHLDWLINAGVIERDGCYYSFKKDFDHWRVSRALQYSPENMAKLVHLNIAERGSPESSLKGNNAPSDTPEEIAEKGMVFLPKREWESSLKGNNATHETGTAKESVKESVKENNGSSSNEKQPDEEDLFQTFQANVGGITPSIQEEIRIIITKIPPSWVNDAIKETGKKPKERRSWGYVAAVLQNWVRDGRNVGPPENKSDSAKYTNGKFSHLVNR